MTFQEQIELYLEPLPSEWKEKLTTLLCQIKAEKTEPDCATVKECETVTSLSDFSISGTTVSVKYTDERGAQVTRSFDVSEILNQSLDTLDPSCLTDPTDWNTLTYQQRLQLIIDAHCDCCS